MSLGGGGGKGEEEESENSQKCDTLFEWSLTTNGSISENTFPRIVITSKRSNMLVITIIV